MLIMDKLCLLLNNARKVIVTIVTFFSQSQGICFIGKKQFDTFIEEVSSRYGSLLSKSTFFFSNQI